MAVVFQSTLPMRGVTESPHAHQCKVAISIHTPHAGSDGPPEGIHGYCPISIHTPHAGSDDAAEHVLRQLFQFQSTLPMRGVTQKYVVDTPNGRISIHTPHAGSDLPCFLSNILHSQFQSTLPMRGVTLIIRL